MAFNSNAFNPTAFHCYVLVLPKWSIPIIMKWITPTVIVNRVGELIALRIAHRPFQPPKVVQPVSPVPDRSEKVGAVRYITRIKPKWEIKVIRGGDVVYHKKRIRDLLVWRGQSILAYLVTQGAKGTATDTWKVIASENTIAPDMGDDSGDPEANEFDPIIGTPVAVTYDFQPTIKPSGSYQTYAEISFEGTIVSDGTKTLRKIGVIDDVAPPNRHIFCEDSVVPFPVVENDELYIRYVIQLG
jgi:hypothetical protein